MRLHPCRLPGCGSVSVDPKLQQTSSKESSGLDTQTKNNQLGRDDQAQSVASKRDDLSSFHHLPDHCRLATNRALSQTIHVLIDPDQRHRPLPCEPLPEFRTTCFSRKLWRTRCPQKMLFATIRDLAKAPAQREAHHDHSHGKTALRRQAEGAPHRWSQRTLKSQETEAVDSPKMTPTSCRSQMWIANCKALQPLTAESQKTRPGHSNCSTGRAARTAARTEARWASHRHLAWAANSPADDRTSKATAPQNVQQRLEHNGPLKEFTRGARKKKDTRK